ncbi:MAG: nucleoside-diphosphate kinase [Bacillota bacterium]
MDQKTLVIIKPDGVRRNLIGKITDYYESAGLRVLDIEMLQIDEKTANIHYREHKGKDFFEELIDYITSGPSVIIELAGEDAISAVRRINDEIRKNYRINTTQNTVHGSDSPESAEREIILFFGRQAI